MLVFSPYTVTSFTALYLCVPLLYLPLNLCGAYDHLYLYKPSTCISNNEHKSLINYYYAYY